MNIYAKYHEDDATVDVIYVPDSLIIDMECKQDEFFKWLFDKRNDHAYWKVMDGEKTHCEYDVEAFVHWLNDGIYINDSDRARVVEKNSSIFASDARVIFF